MTHTPTQMSLWLPPNLSGVDTAQVLRRSSPNPRILRVSDLLFLDRNFGICVKTGAHDLSRAVSTYF
jgi:hypothetical protein